MSAAHLLVEFEQLRRDQNNEVREGQTLGPFAGEDGLPIRVMKELMKLLEKSVGTLPTGDAFQEFLGQIFDQGWTSSTLNPLPPHPIIVPVIDRALVSTVMIDVGQVVDRRGKLFLFHIFHVTVGNQSTSLPFFLLLHNGPSFPSLFLPHRLSSRRIQNADM